MAEPKMYGSHRTDGHRYWSSELDHLGRCRTTSPTRESASSDRRLGDDVFVSAASTWEIAIKYAQGKLSLPSPSGVYVPARLRHYGFKDVAITVDHTLALSELPPHHADPFDRILVAQAQVEVMTIVSVDPNMRKYSVDVLHS